MNTGRPAIDELGNTYGRLTVTARAESKNKMARWECVCICGNSTTVYGMMLRRGMTRSCGCLIADTNRELKSVGDDASYSAVHDRLRKQRGWADTHDCVDCGEQAREWSYSGGVGFSLDLDEYDPRCATCHKRYDKERRKETMPK